jgi:hypothetical protein
MKVILPYDFCRYETWYITLREGHRMRGFEKRMLRGIFGPKKAKVTKEWRKLYSLKI